MGSVCITQATINNVENFFAINVRYMLEYFKKLKEKRKQKEVAKRVMERRLALTDIAISKGDIVMMINLDQILKKEGLI